jgi:hypothetical protein
MNGLWVEGRWVYELRVEGLLVHELWSYSNNDVD